MGCGSPKVGNPMASILNPKALGTHIVRVLGPKTILRTRVSSRSPKVGSAIASILKSILRTK